MNGFIPLWKPAGLTSFDCVMKIRKLLKTKKVGHTGTLDPSVTGVLPIAIGEATKVIQFVEDTDKEYIAEVSIGFSTTTEDADGEIVEKKPVEQPISRQAIMQVLQQLTGKITQVPPMYSAIKVNGKRLYEYAREGKVIERKPRTITIYEIEMLDDHEEFTGDVVRFSIRVKCSKGTYIRTLAVQIGELLGYPAHMSKLVRTEATNFTESQCYTFEDLEELINNGNIQKAILPIKQALNELPKYQIHDTLAKKIKNGAVLPLPDQYKLIDSPIAIEYDDQIIAIYKKHPTKEGLMKPARVFPQDSSDI